MPMVMEQATIMENHRRKQPGLLARVGLAADFGSSFTSPEDSGAGPVGSCKDSVDLVVLKGFATCGAPGIGTGWAAYATEAGSAGASKASTGAGGLGVPRFDFPSGTVGTGVGTGGAGGIGGAGGVGGFGVEAAGDLGPFDGVGHGFGPGLVSGTRPEAGA